jgi:hypothetical protein
LHTIKDSDKLDFIFLSIVDIIWEKNISIVLDWADSKVASEVFGAEVKDNIKPETHGCNYFDFHKYAIIDDDSDMLLNQRFNFFQTDNYSGLTPNTCYKIKRFFTGRTFGSPNGA